jgi:hypothetical protein
MASGRQRLLLHPRFRFGVIGWNQPGNSNAEERSCDVRLMQKDLRAELL